MIGSERKKIQCAERERERERENQPKEKSETESNNFFYLINLHAAYSAKKIKMYIYLQVASVSDHLPINSRVCVNKVEVECPLLDSFTIRKHRGNE